ncbi:PREDICTED: uncharacterized protein LOC104611391 isoform X2 [Nelumbo nucifera]|uniref:PGG domain-containing protein n=2 Tax=Nelumbo nucifera TaxID=4432 RepID=A0A822ZID0_NELNU|nr:PREDICTED: uncharacterized protein LOC104611391 isoform X2 [Nelumbo nucifera]DAD45864.1 TPA_asm: hypothetical protein HUJ06_004094 [Nelumbo nucifera]
MASTAGQTSAASQQTPTTGKNVLHVAALAGRTEFVKKLLDSMTAEQLGLKDDNKCTALTYAVRSGNVEIAKLLVGKNDNLTQIQNEKGWFPILEAAILCQKGMLNFLLSVTKDEDGGPFRGKKGALILVNALYADFYDFAKELLDKFPKLATERDPYGNTAFRILAYKPVAFKSGSRLGFWQNCIYSWVEVEQASTCCCTKGDIENSMQSPTNCSFLQSLKTFLRPAVILKVPCIKHVHDMKLMHMQVQKLINRICAQVLLLNDKEEIKKLFMEVLVSAKFGIIELIQICVQAYPEVLWYETDGRNILHLAIEYRQEEVFNILRGSGAFFNILANPRLRNLNSIIHLAAKLAPPSKLNSVSGAALQMQRELQWFKEVEKIPTPGYNTRPNNSSKIAKDMFTEEHKDLLEKAEKWMKDTAASCMVVATLIATVVFTAAFTVPGGNNSDSGNNYDKGSPIFLEEKSFMVFAISDAIALFFSTSSVLMFLSILTSRYAEEDFLKSLPTKLIIGLVTLFFSIAAMMIAFSATFFIIFSHRFSWLSILIAALATFPVTLFALSHARLLAEIVISTYGSGIFQQNRSIFPSSSGQEKENMH